MWLDPLITNLRLQGVAIPPPANDDSRYDGIRSVAKAIAALDQTPGPATMEMPFTLRLSADASALGGQAATQVRLAQRLFEIDDLRVAIGRVGAEAVAGGGERTPFAAVEATAVASGADMVFVFQRSASRLAQLDGEGTALVERARLVVVAFDLPELTGEGRIEWLDLARSGQGGSRRAEFALGRDATAEAVAHAVASGSTGETAAVTEALAGPGFALSGGETAGLIA